MKKNYVLEWLDEVVSIQLNPETKGRKRLSSEESNAIKERIEVEERAVISRLKTRLFSIKDEAASRSLVKRYHDDLVIMITKNYDYLHHPSAQQLGLNELHKFIGERLHQILYLFEKELSSFLNTENLVPITSLIQLKSEILASEQQMKKNLATGDHGMAPVDIVMEVVDDFISKIDERLPITVREVNYLKDLVHDVLHIDGNLTSITGCPALNELLITWNLNSKNCIRYFTAGTEMLIGTYQTEEEKLAFLQLESKKLDNIPERQNFILDPDFPSVKAYCSKWLANEIAYRESRLEGFVPIANKGIQKDKKASAFKVMVNLSVDQVSLILKAADELRILSARSLRAVFTAIIPYISTPGSANPSPDNARGGSYTATQHDIEECCATLDALKKQIQSY